jgi:WXG100 family type VII secretion target
MTTFSMTYGTVGQVIDEFTSVNGAIAGILDDVNTTTNTLLNVDSWLGDAQELYYACQANWNGAAADMGKLVQTASTALDSAMLNVQTTDQLVANTFS